MDLRVGLKPPWFSRGCNYIFRLFHRNVGRYLSGWNILNDFLLEEYRKMACFGAKCHEIGSFWRQN